MTIPLDDKERLEQILDDSWSILRTQQDHGAIKLQSEAQFQYHFSNIIADIGRLYCIREDDCFDIDPEERFQINGKNKFFDIYCRLNDTKAVAELKFVNGATDWTRIGVYNDLEKLESLPPDITVKRFYLITNSSSYLQNNTRLSKIIPISDKRKIKGPTTIKDIRIGTYGPYEITLKGSYMFNWSPPGKWRYLSCRQF